MIKQPSDAYVDELSDRSGDVGRFAGRETFPQKSGKAPPGKGQNDVSTYTTYVPRARGKPIWGERSKQRLMLWKELTLPRWCQRYLPKRMGVPYGTDSPKAYRIH
jgi:hypothetical protein